MKEIRYKITIAVWTMLIQLPVLLFIAYMTAHHTVTIERKEQENYEQEYVENLKESLRYEVRINARNIRKCIPHLVVVTNILQDFVNNENHDRPGANPGYGSLMVTASQALIESPVAARHILPCLHNTLAAMHYRLREGNDIKREVDTALVEYTGTFPRPLSDAYVAAARLHARIEQLLYVYKKLPYYLDGLGQVIDAHRCDEEIEIGNNS